MNPPRPAIPPAAPGNEESFWKNDSGDALPTAAGVPAWAHPAGHGGQGEPGSLPDGRRFAALSTLPEGRRLPTKRDVPLARHLRQDQNPDEGAPPLSPESYPGQLPPAEARQLGFNCPSCFAVLIIKDPSTYDGRPAPCPTCGIRIQPPQCVPESPFSIVHRPGPEEAPAPRRLRS